MKNVETPGAEHKRKIRELIRSIRTASMVTMTPEGLLHARPMATAELEEDWNEIYFATQRSSGKVEELQSDPRVCLSYANATGSEWLSISGRALVVDDRRKIHALWTDFWKAWFDGPEDPNLVLLRIEPELAEYWTSPGKLVVWAKMAAAAVTGAKPQVGESHKVDMERLRGE